MLEEDFCADAKRGNEGANGDGAVVDALKFDLAGTQYLAVPASGPAAECLGRRIIVENIGPCLVTGSLLVGDAAYLVLCSDHDDHALPEQVSVWAMLSRRELEIAILVSHGKVNKQIAHQLRISEYTVASYMRRIFAKLGVSSRAAMVACLMDYLSHR